MHAISPDVSTEIGRHLLADFHGVDPALLRDPERLRQHLLAAAAALGVTVLGAHLHHFGAGAGVTGVLLLAESHMSIHTWPEFGFAAVDVFTCGSTAPQVAIDCLARCWAPSRVESAQAPRGRGLGETFALGANPH